MIFELDAKPVAAKTDDRTHQIIGQFGDAHGHPPWTVRARCGYENVRVLGQDLPVEFTAWDSRVTCSECRP